MHWNSSYTICLDMSLLDHFDHSPSQWHPNCSISGPPKLHWNSSYTIYLDMSLLDHFDHFPSQWHPNCSEIYLVHCVIQIIVSFRSLCTFQIFPTSYIHILVYLPDHYIIWIILSLWKLGISKHPTNLILIFHSS